MPCARAPACRVRNLLDAHHLGQVHCPGDTGASLGLWSACLGAGAFVPPILIVPLSSFHLQAPPEGEPLQSTQSVQPAPSTQATQPVPPPAPPCQPSQLSQPAQPPSGKIPQVSQEAKGTQTGGVEQTRLPAIPTNRPSEPHVAQVQRVPVETAQPAHPSPVSVSMKPDLPSPLSSQAAPKQPLFVPANSGPSTPPGLALPHAEAQSAPKQDSSPHVAPQRPVDMVQLLKVRWQRLLLAWHLCSKV